MYQRKTTDEYVIEGRYALGFEPVTFETTPRDARRVLREYRENEPGIAFRIVKRRVKKV